MEKLSGTKELIFDAFVEMISALGYENVSMRDIAEKVGIKGSSIYNHFESKGKILECAYNYYSNHFYDNRTPVDAVKKISKRQARKKSSILFRIHLSLRIKKSICG